MIVITNVFMTQKYFQIQHPRGGIRDGRAFILANQMHAFD